MLLQCRSTCPAYIIVSTHTCEAWHGCTCVVCQVRRLMTIGHIEVLRKGPTHGMLKGDVGCAGYELAKNAMKNRDNAAQAAATQEMNGIDEQIANAAK